MEKVTGIGGFFFRAKNPGELGRWYREVLGIELPPDTYESPVWKQQQGATVFAAFKQDSDVFGSPDKGWMLNFRVKDLDAMVSQLLGHGVEVKVDPEVYPNGRFAYFADPEGNPLQIWQPGGRDAETP